MSPRSGSYEQARREAAMALKLEEERIDRLIAEESRRLTEDMRKITGRNDIGVSWADRPQHQTHANGNHNQEVDMASVVSGSVTIGGTVFGAVEADIKLDDGTSWHYAGYYADCGAGVGVCNSPSGDFPGESHMSGSCFMSVIQVPGGFGVSFDDFHGHIGTLGGVFIGAVIELGVGGGAWTKENGAEAERRELKEGDKVTVEMEHEFVGQKAEEDDDDGA